MRVPRVALLLCSLWFALAAAGPWPGAANAAGPIDARELQARKDFAAGRYEQSAETFAELFAETGDAVFLRNIARCYQKLKRPDEAIANFEEYLAKGKLSKDERAEIQSYVAEMQALKRTAALPPASLLGAPQAVAADSAGLVAAAAPSRESPPVSGPPAVAAQVQEVDRPFFVTRSGHGPGEEQPGGDMKREGRTFKNGETIAGIATAVAGAALVGTGFAFGLATKSAAHDVSIRWDAQRDSAGRRNETLQWVAYGAGSAALVAGVLLILHGSERAAHASQVSEVSQLHDVRLHAAAWPPALDVQVHF